MKVNRRGRSETVEVTADGEGFCSQAGALLLTNLADRLGFTEGLTEALAPTRERRSAHDDGEVLRDLVVTLCQGGEHLADLAARRWPWAEELAAAFARLRELPLPAG